MSTMAKEDTTGHITLLSPGLFKAYVTREPPFFSRIRTRIHSDIKNFFSPNQFAEVNNCRDQKNMIFLASILWILCLGLMSHSIAILVVSLKPQEDIHRI